MTFLAAVQHGLTKLRKDAGKSTKDVEKALGLGPGWVDGMEKGAIVPGIDVLSTVLAVYGKTVADLIDPKVLGGASPAIARDFCAEQMGNDLKISFRYAAYDAEVRLPNATMAQFDSVLGLLRKELGRLHSESEDFDADAAEAIKTGAVAEMFLAATRTWPDANPSDLWWFIVYRAYCDRFNHPVEHARLDLSQSWKRTGGWALEEIVIRHYGPFLKKHGVNLFIAGAEEKRRILDKIKLSNRLEVDKVDVLLTGDHKGEEYFFGVLHVKASFAERRTDDVPLSQSLVAKGYFSPLWTMDCKGSPAARPFNWGELGETWMGKGPDNRSAKRKDIEDDGYFTTCFSYNANTKPTHVTSKTVTRVVVCDFKNPNDAFAKATLNAWAKFRDQI